MSELQHKSQKATGNLQEECEFSVLIWLTSHMKLVLRQTISCYCQQNRNKTKIEAAHTVRKNKKLRKKYSPTMKQMKMWFDFEQPVEYNFFKFWPWGLEDSLSSSMD